VLLSLRVCESVYFHMNSALVLLDFISHGHAIHVVSISHAHLHNSAGHMVALF